MMQSQTLILIRTIQIQFLPSAQFTNVVQKRKFWPMKTTLNLWGCVRI